MLFLGCECGFMQHETLAPGTREHPHAKAQYIIIIILLLLLLFTASVVEWAEFLVADAEVPGSIPGAARFSE
jgi:hypothetical protein